MTKLTPREQAERYLTITQETDADWKTHAPAEYQNPWTKGNGVGRVEGLFVISGGVAVIATLLMFGGQYFSDIVTAFLATLFFLFFYFYLWVRDAMIRREFVRKRDSAISLAKIRAGDYIHDRCDEEGFSVADVRGWMRTQRQDYELYSALIEAGLRPTPRFG